MTGQPEGLARAVSADRAGDRLDAYLAAAHPEHSRSRLAELVRGGAVTVNGHPSRPSHRLVEGDIVAARVDAIPDAPSPTLIPENIPLCIVHEDDEVVVLDKPAGMVVHPAVGHHSGTLVHALLARYPELEGSDDRRPGIVHRLDKDTSGLMLVARTERSREYLKTELQERRVLKEYAVLCCGTLDPSAARIDAPIGRHPSNRHKMAVVSNGKPALTEYETVERFAGHTLARARIHTGRTHQIRVHLASVGRPVAGDRSYGRCEAPGLARQFLHSARLGLRLPDGRVAEWSIPLPPDLEAALAALRSGE